MSRGRRRRPPRGSIALGEVGLIAFAGYVAWQHNPGLRIWVIGAAAAIGVVVLGWQAMRLRRRRNRLAGANLYRLSPAEFEEAVAAILRRNGWRDVEVSGGAGDLGADVVGIDPEGRRVVVQAKRYAPGNRVGSPEVQVLMGSQRIHEADRAMIVTTSGFTRAAVKLAGDFGDVDLVDGAALGALARA